MQRRTLVALAALAATLAAPAFAQSGEIRIAHVHSMTGPLEAYGKQTQTGLMMGLEYATGGTMMVRTNEIISHTMCGLDNLAIGGFGLSELVPRLRMVVVLPLGESLTAADLVGPISACLLVLCADADEPCTRACCSAINLST